MNHLPHISLTLGFLCATAATASADQFGPFSYSVHGDTVQITGYSHDGPSEVNIPSKIEGKPVTSIGLWAFLARAALTSITVPEGVVYIDTEAFFGCQSLTTVTIPASLTRIGLEAFSGCSALTSFHVAEGNLNFASVEGVLFDANKTTLIRFPQAKQGAYTTPDGVTRITGRKCFASGCDGEGAFLGCSAVTSITIPKSVTDIGDFAFERCTGLTSVTIPSSVTYLGESAFEGCTGMTSVTIPSSISYFGEAAFQDCTGLINIELNHGLTVIGHGAFHRCTSLTGVTIPSSVTGTGNFAFRGCTGLTNIELNQGLDAIGDRTFSGCIGLTGVTIPSSVTGIGEAAFSGCSALTSVSIPEGVTGIGRHAFQGCASLTEAIFFGNSPPTGSFGVFAFSETASDFTIYYFSTSSGFTSPTWHGHPAQPIDESTYPAARWLLSHGVPYDTDLHQNPNSDGVSLLLAYALDLDPTRNLRSQLPVPALGESDLRLTFHAASPGVTYRVETSTDVKNWTTEEVALSDLDGQGRRTATVDRDSSGQRFMRLVVED